MVTQTTNRARNRNGLFPTVLGAICLSLSGCAEIEIGAELFKNVPRASSAPPAQPALAPPPAPVLQSAARSSSIEPSMRPDPQAFHANGLAVWDGSQTLQGVWIAHPMAQIARRVRLTNGETGVQVDAAMFRRDANLSGPQLIVSSEAARLLGLKAGHGTPITIDGLAYRTDIEAATASAVAQVNPAVIEGTAIEPAQARIAPVSVDQPAQPVVASAAPEMAPETDPIANGAEPEPMDVVESAVASLEPDPVLPAQTSADVAITTGNEGAQIPEVEIPQAVNSPPPTQKVNPTATEPDGNGDITDGRYFVQAGVFSQAENATRLVETLRAAGLPANELPITLGTRQFMRVLVGPYKTVAKRNAALETVRRIGPTDATTSRG